MRTMGWVLVVLGLVLGVYALEFFPTYTTDPDGTIGRVDDFGLVIDRLGLIGLSGFLFVGGLVLAAAGSIVAALKPRAPADPGGA